MIKKTSNTLLMLLLLGIAGCSAGLVHSAVKTRQVQSVSDIARPTVTAGADAFFGMQ